MKKLFTSHPPIYFGFKAVILQMNGKIISHEKLQSIEIINEKIVCLITTENTYQCKNVVLACGPWINKVLKSFDDYQVPVTVNHKLLSLRL